jgi:hypothetical protein
LAAAAIAATAVALIASAPASAEPRVVGGQATTIEEWPWQVAIATPGTSSAYNRQFCGGSLVAPAIVITAGHCAATFNGTNFKAPSNFSVIAGRTKLSSNAGQEIAVNEVWYFVDDGLGGAELEAQTDPGVGEILFDDFTLEWDAVFLELASTASPPAAAIKIAGPDETATWAPDQPAFVTGWGNTECCGFPDDLQEAQVRMISDSACGSGDVYGSDFIAETMVCAGELAGGVDTCQGDSGGPLVVPLAGGEFRLVGDTSWGIGCAEPFQPGVYGRIAADPLRSALAAGIQEVAGVDVLGSGGQPAPPLPPVDPGAGDDPSGLGPFPAVPASIASACTDARKKLRRARAKLRRAKRKLAKADSKVEERRGEKRVKKAKRRIRRAKRAVNSACP